MNDRVPVPAPGVCVAYLDGEAVLYEAERARPVLLNGTAAAVWASVDGEATVAEIVATLAEAFGADEAVVRPDVEAALGMLADLGLLTV